MDKRGSLNQNNSDSGFYSYHGEQSSRGGYTSRELARTEYAFPVARSHAAPDAFHREIQKEHIRAQMLMDEIAKKRLLEADVRRDLLMLEEELARTRATSGLLLGLPARMIHDDRFGMNPQGLDLRSLIPRSGTRMEGRVALSPERTERQNGRSERRSFKSQPLQRENVWQRSVKSQPAETSCLETVPEGRRKSEETDKLSSEKKEIPKVKTAPFQMGLGCLRISEVIPITGNGKEKKKIILMPNTEPISDGVTSGSKRKAATPPPEEPKEDTSKRPKEIGSLKKKAKPEWSCVLCPVVVNSEAALQGHLQGKRHKLKVAEIRKSKPGEGMDFDALDSSSKSVIEPKKTEETTQTVRKRGNYKFWCDLCQIGTPTQKIMECHKVGKKHMKFLKESEDKGIKIVAAPVDCVEQVSENGNTATAEIVDKVSEKAGQEDHKAPDESKVGKDGKDSETNKQEPVDEPKVEGVDATSKITEDELVDEAKAGGMDATEPMDVDTSDADAFGETSA